MDSLGFALEGFDAIGPLAHVRRASATRSTRPACLPDGSRFEGIDAVPRRVDCRRSCSASCSPRSSWCTRSGAASSPTTCRRCARSCATRRTTSNRFSQFILGVVNSTPFRMRRIGIMMITKRSLPRRTFLKGAGATIGLPLLDAMVPAFASEAPKAKRIGFVYLPNGVAKNFTGIDYWTAEGRRASSSSCRRSLRRSPPYRDRADGRQRPRSQRIAEANAEDGATATTRRRPRRGSPACAASAPKAPTSRCGTSADQIAAQRARAADGAAVARAVDRFERARGHVRQRVQLRVFEHAVVELADDAAAEREQSARRVRAACSATAARTSSARRRRAQDRSILDFVERRLRAA